MSFTLPPIGIIRSCFKEKFGIPRQAGLAGAATATLELLPPYNRPEALTGLRDFSHVWLVFVFHAAMREHWKATVRPPRLGGNQRLGVFATRSTFRPNPIGLSAVKLEGVQHDAGHVWLHLSGVDLLDGTPVLDIKPYLPYADSITEASGGFAKQTPMSSLTVTFTPQAEARCQAFESRYPNLKLLIEQILEQDPRPAYYAHRPQKQQFGLKLFDFDLKWELVGETITVLDLVTEL